MSLNLHKASKLRGGPTPKRVLFLGHGESRCGQPELGLPLQGTDPVWQKRPQGGSVGCSGLRRGSELELTVTKELRPKVHCGAGLF